MSYHLAELDQRVAFQSRTAVRDGAGGVTDTWSTYATVWAMVRPMSGRERQNAQRPEATSDYLVVIRLRDDVFEGHRIVWRGRHLNIRFVKERGPRHNFLEIEAEKGVTT